MSRVNQQPDAVIFFDIETTGFIVGKVVAFAVKKLDGPCISIGNRWQDDSVILEKLAETLMDYAGDAVQPYISTYNGESWKGGFDLPFLRTACVLNKVAWPFSGYKHLDLFPLIEKRFNFKFFSDDEKKLSIKPGNKLDHVYEVLGGPKLGCEDWSGANVPTAYNEYVKTGDDSIISKIEQYNLTDVKQLEYVYKAVLPYLPPDEVYRAWSLL